MHQRAPEMPVTPQFPAPHQGWKPRHKLSNPKIILLLQSPHNHRGWKSTINIKFAINLSGLVSTPNTFSQSNNRQLLNPDLRRHVRPHPPKTSTNQEKNHPLAHVRFKTTKHLHRNGQTSSACPWNSSNSANPYTSTEGGKPDTN